MGKLATTGRLVTRDNEERKASVWLVGRSGASSGCALLAVSIGRRRRSVRGDLTVARSKPIERNDIGTGARSCLAFTASRRTSGNDRAIIRRNRSPSSPDRDDRRHDSRSAAIETAVDYEGGLVRLGVSSLVSSQVRQELCSSDDDDDDDVVVVEAGNELKYRWRYFGKATIVAVAATLCATAASAVPTLSRETDPLSRTGPWHDLDRSTGLEDVYEDAFEDVFPEEIRPTTRTVLDETELNIIRRSIARGLGLERIPDPSKANVSQTEYERAHDEYLKKIQLSSNGQTIGGEKKLHVFSATAYPGNESSRLPEANDGEGHCRHRLYFPVEIPAEDRRHASPSVDHATLRLLLHGPTTDDYTERSELDALLYFKMARGSRKLISRKSVELRNARNSKWLEFDATVAVGSWLDDALDNLGLELEFRSDGEPVRRNFSTPFLNVFTAASGRTKRSSPEELMSLHKGRRTKCKGESKKCCRHELTVMFKDLKGFEFIVYPKTFDAGFCKGRCPPRYNPAHHHALLQSLLWKEDRKKVPKPCCAPSKLDQLMIVYFDENDSTQLKVSYWQNIQVLECACS